MGPKKLRCDVPRGTHPIALTPWLFYTFSRKKIQWKDVHPNMSYLINIII